MSYSHIKEKNTHTLFTTGATTFHFSFRCKKARSVSYGLFLNKSLAMSYSHIKRRTPTRSLPPALTHFTSGIFQHHFSENKSKKARSISYGLFLNRSLAMTYSHMGTPTLPSAQLRFTSEFGKGSGGAIVLLSLDKKGYNLGI